MRPIVVYALWRTALFLVPFALIIAVGWEWYVALAIALVFAFCASYIFLRKQRLAATEAMQRMREGRGTQVDEDVEDDAIAVERDVSRPADAPASSTATDITEPAPTVPEERHEDR